MLIMLEMHLSQSKRKSDDGSDKSGFAFSHSLEVVIGSGV